jgi:hypothetical protein
VQVPLVLFRSRDNDASVIQPHAEAVIGAFDREPGIRAYFDARAIDQRQ